MSLLIVLAVLVACTLLCVRLGRGLRAGTIAAALLLAGLALLLPIGLDPAIVVDRGRLCLFTAGFAVPVFVVLAVWARRGNAGTPVRWPKLFLLAAAGSGLFALALVRAANMDLDGSAPTPHAAVVEALESVGGRKGGRTWHVELGSTDVANVERLRIDEELYARLRTGMPVNVLVHDGAFGIRWVSGVE